MNGMVAEMEEARVRMRIQCIHLDLDTPLKLPRYRRLVCKPSKRGRRRRSTTLKPQSGQKRSPGICPRRPSTIPSTLVVNDPIMAFRHSLGRLLDMRPI
jgi:hypothetical protein